jgi:hypothetical protein
VLKAYMMGHDMTIIPAPSERKWMDETRQRHAYRCLPLSMANAYGWQILNPGEFSAHWTGGPELHDVIVDWGKTREYAWALSHFGHGILTFHVNCLFRTQPGVNLMATGPMNMAKDGISPLSGIIETDWSPYTFTMNWKFTRAHTTVIFDKDEPFCQIFPVRLAEIERESPVFEQLEENPGLKKQYEDWCGSRENFIGDLNKSGSEAQKQGWQRRYHKGHDMDGQKTGEHRTKLKLKSWRWA